MNSRSQTIVGLAMDAEDQTYLHDIYELFHKEKAVEQTAYIMQFLWRDLTSSYDIGGPYLLVQKPFQLSSSLLVFLRQFNSSR